MNIVYGVLWSLPLLIALALFGVFYCKRGYKKGPVRAMLCLASTVASALVSWLAALLLSGLLTEPIAALIADMIPGAGLLIAGFVTVISQCMAKVLMGIVVFAVMFYILLPVLGFVFKKIKVSEEVTQKGKVAGALIRGVDALLAALLVMLPLYGLLMVGAGPAAILMGGDVAVLETAASHPARYVYQYGPVAPVINTLTKVEVNNQKVNFVDVTSGLGKISQPYAQMASMPEGEAKTAAGNALISTLSVEVIQKEWCYHITMQALTEMDTLLNEPGFSENADVKRDYINAFRMTEWEFYENTDPMVQVVASALELDLTRTLLDPNQEMPEVPAAFLERVGDLLNCSPKMIEVKKVILRNALIYIAEENGVSDPRDTANTIIEYGFSEKATPEELRIAEAKSYIMILRATDLNEMVEAVNYNPTLFGTD